MDKTCTREFVLISSFYCQSNGLEKEVKFYQGKVAAAIAERDKAIVEVRTCIISSSHAHELVKYIPN